jgi:hypothetical protein
MSHCTISELTAIIISIGECDRRVPRTPEDVAMALLFLYILLYSFPKCLYNMHKHEIDARDSAI